MIDTAEKSQILPAKRTGSFGTGASFTLANRLVRLLWSVVWLTCIRWTPGFLNPWRIFLLTCFGAKVSSRAAIAGSARIWLPSNLQIGDRSTLGPGVDCYNMAPITIGERTVISQRAFLCAGTHDIQDADFQLVARPITIGNDVWIAAEAFVAPGVAVGDGTVLGARACAFDNLSSWTVYRGNPAVAIRARKWRIARHASQDRG
jgi:putative colanic acid biosynthesis acetyltransferase WcaF